MLYILYTNDLPEAIHEHEPQPNKFYNVHCHSCGGLCLYADDSTFTLSIKDVEDLIENVDIKYKVIAQYMDKNKLILNGDKTHLLVMTSARKHLNHHNFGIYLKLTRFSREQDDL